MAAGVLADDELLTGPPSPEFLALLNAAELADLTDGGLVDVIAGYERMASAVAGRQLVALAEFSGRRPGGDREFAADEIAPAMTLTRFSSELRLSTAEVTSFVVPAVLEGMLAGQISLAKAQIITEMTRDLDETTTCAAVTTVIADVPGWTTGQLRHHLAQAILNADPDAARRRAERAKKTRDVWLTRAEDGNASLGALLDAYDAAAAFEIINQAAKTARTPGDDRSIGEVRADVLLDLILGRRPSSTPPAPPPAPDSTQPTPPRAPGPRSTPTPEPPPAAASAPASPTSPATGPPAATDPAARPAATHPAVAQAPSAGSPESTVPGDGDLNRGASVTSVINVVISLSTLAALLFTRDHTGPDDPVLTSDTLTALPAGHDLPGWIEGLGPLAGSSIREIVWDLLNGTRATSAKTGWRIIACDDDTGAVHALGHTRYRPPPALQELVRLRDRTCRFPGCRQPATRCDLDHATPFNPSNPTSGPTCDCNLHALCRHHHRLKQHPGWTVTLHNGTSTWTSTTGHTYTDHPHPDWPSNHPSDHHPGNHLPGNNTTLASPRSSDSADCADSSDSSDSEDWSLQNGWIIREGWTIQNGELAPYPEPPSHHETTSTPHTGQTEWPGRTSPTLSRRRNQGTPPPGNNTNPHDDLGDPPY